jgi:hypothetical protein
MSDHPPVPVPEEGDEMTCPKCGSSEIATDHPIFEENGEWEEGKCEGIWCFDCDYSEGTLTR